MLLKVVYVSGRKDVKDEFQVMTSALSKEIGMMESQLNRWKQTADEALSLREKAQSLSALLEAKVCFVLFHGSLQSYKNA